MDTPNPPDYQDSQAAIEGTFRGSALDLSPPWLSGEVGARLMYAQNIQLDALGEYLKFGVLQRMPQWCLPTMLPALGKDKKIFRGLSESDDNYARRLVQFKPTWKLAGNAPTLLRQLWELQRPYATRMRYVVNGYDDPELADASTQFTDWWTIEDGPDGEPLLSYERVSPSNWDWDASYGYNIRFWVIVYRTDFSPAVWGVPPYDWAKPDLLWGAAPGADTSWIVDTFNVVQTFKAAGSHMGPFPTFQGGLIIADAAFVTSPWGADGPFPPDAAPGYPMPDGTFDTPANWPAGAIYMSGL